MDEGQSQRKRKRAETGRTKEASAPAFVSPIRTGDQYDVFLSFRGSDTRKGFTDHLYHSLMNAGIVRIFVFRDENSIPIGEEFGSQVLNAITRSKISIPIISENYASSKWCLRELIRIMNCHKSTTHIVLPIFYKVAPSDVRHLNGKFGLAFHSRQECIDMKDIEEGQRALKEVSDLNGWESEKIADGHEGELIKLVVKTILTELRKDFQLHVPKELVGLHGRLKEITRWIDSHSINARMIGIYGMGRIGKTTLAKCIYNQLLNKFEGVSFLQDIRETTHRHGIEHLQSQLISDVLQSQSLSRESRFDDGINIIKSRFEGKKVLIVLDDIDHKDQLDALAGERNWFMTGSIVLVTTRYEAVLDQSEFEVNYKYEMNEMGEVHSLLLFNRHAFRMDHSPSNFEGISHDIISTMGGLPLAVKVTGSYLYKKTNLDVWNDVLTQLKERLHRDVENILKISYDALEEEQKEIFLDIACFFIGEESKYAMYMWHNCGFYPNEGIEELKLRCLIKIGDDGKLRMHDQLRDLARSIICKGQSLEERSRLWDGEKAFQVLTEKKGTKMIRAMCVKKTPKFENHSWAYTSKQFKNLRNLRFLQLGQATLSGDFANMFSELRWLEWNGPGDAMSSSAANLHLPKLVVVQLSEYGRCPFNPLTENWRGWSSITAAKRLKVLNLKYCRNLRCTPDLSALTELEILILSDCCRLKQVHPSIGQLKCLISLDLGGCGCLNKLPEEIGGLKQLETLILDCSGIIKIPTSISAMQKLKNLSANGCQKLRKIPNSIGNLSSLQHLKLDGCSSLTDIPSSMGDLQNLQSLDILCYGIKQFPNTIGRLKKLRSLSLLSKCNAEIPCEIGDLSSLQQLCLNSCLIGSLIKLPSGLTDLRLTCDSPSLPQLSCLIHLKELRLSSCMLLEYIPELPSRLLRLVVNYCPKVILPELAGLKYLVELSIVTCSSTERWDLSQSNHLKKLVAGDCDNLVEIQLPDDLESLEEIDIYGCGSIQRLTLPRCLKKLKAKYCNNLVEIQVFDDLASLEEIVIVCCGSIQRLILPKLQWLKKLNATSCGNLLEIRGLDRAEFLVELDISECGSIERLPDLSCFATLKNLNINGCHCLRGVESLERFLSCRSIFIMGCESLEELPNLSKFENLRRFTILDSPLITDIPGIGESRSLTDIYIVRCQSLETLPDLSGCEKLQHLIVAQSKKLTQLPGIEKLDLPYLAIYGCNSLELPELPNTCVVRYDDGYINYCLSIGKIEFQ